MTDSRMYELMEKAEEKIKKALEGTDFYMDDQACGEQCFRIGIWEFNSKKPSESKEVDEFFYWYEEFETYYGSDEKQLEEQLESFLLEFEQEH